MIWAEDFYAPNRVYINRINVGVPVFLRDNLQVYYGEGKSIEANADIVAYNEDAFALGDLVMNREVPSMMSDVFNKNAIERIMVIKDSKTGLDHGVKVWFKDGTYTQAVCQGDDKFDFDTGITICMMKKILGGKQNGNYAYNKMIRDVRKKYKDMCVEDEKQKEIEAMIERKRAKRAKKKLAKEARKRQEKIDILAEAIKKATAQS